MVLAQSDENIKYLNASLVSKLRDYNIKIPSFTIPDVLTQEGFRNAMKEVPFNDNGWIENTLNCLDIGTTSCRGCDTKQTDYGQCSAGCFGANTCGACVGSCNGGDAVCISCNAQTDDSEIVVCEGCNTGCESCDADCYGCNKGCQGAQTCTKYNDGREIPCEYDAGCTDCQEGHEHEDPTYGCTECVRVCVAPDSCGAGQAPTVDGCTSGNEFNSTGGCVKGNKGCNSQNIFCRQVACNKEYSSNGTDISCLINFGDAVVSCLELHGSTEDSVHCGNSYNSPESFCQTRYSINEQATHCESTYTSEATEIGCQSSYSFTASGETCVSSYTGAGTQCQTNYKISDEGWSCASNYSDGNYTCSSGYTKSGEEYCASGYSSFECSQACPSDYAPSCSGCNATANDQCLRCVSSQDICTACVSGEAASCTSCVEAQGCSDCQGCDSGCNTDVSCNGYSVGENDQNVCVGQYTDTNCSQTCIGGFDSSNMCLSGQGGCSSCDSGCQGCDSCQGRDGPGCTSCDGGGCQTCDGCFGYTPTCTPCVASFACDPCYGNVGGCPFGTEAGS